MKFPFIKNNNKSDKDKRPLYISLDIGTEILKGLLFDMTELGVDVWYSYHIKQQTKAMRSGVILDETTVRENAELVVYKLLEKVEDEANKPQVMVLGLAGELINGISITVDYDRLELADKEITEDEAQHIIDSVFEQIINSGKEELATRINVAPDQVTILHLTVTGFKIDDRRVSDMIGEKGRNLRLYIYASFAPSEHIKTLFKVSKALELKIGSIIVQPFSVASAFAGSSEPNFSGIFIDIGGGTTDVAFVQNGNKVQTQMYAFGGRAFTNRIAKEFNLPFNLAEERKIKYSAGELPLHVRDELRSVLVPDVKLWLESLKVALSQMEDVKEYPGMFYLCGGGALLPDIKELMLTFAWHKYLPFKHSPKVTIVTPERLDKVYDKSGLLVNPYDVTPAALARVYWDVVNRPMYNMVLSTAED